MAEGESKTKSKIEKAVENALESKAALEKELRAEKEEIMAELAKALAAVDGNFVETEIVCMYWSVLWQNRMMKTVAKGFNVTNDTDLNALFGIGKKLSKACFKGLLHILKGASTKMLEEQNPLILIPKAVAGMTTLGGMAAGIYVSCLMNIINTVNKCYTMLGKEKALANALVKSQFGEKVIEECFKKLVESKETIYAKVDEALEQVIVLTFPEFVAPEGEVSPEVEEEILDAIAEALKDLSLQFNLAKTKLWKARGLIPSIVNEYSSILSILENSTKEAYKPWTKDASKNFVKAAKGMIASHDKYAKMIASQFREAKGGEDPTKILLNNCLESELTDEEMKDLFNVNDEELAKMKEQHAEELKAAEKAEQEAKAAAEAAAAEEAAKAEAASSQAADAASAAGDSAEAVPESPKVDPAEKAEDLLDDAQLQMEDLKNIAEAAKSEVEFLTAEVASLTLDKAKDVMIKTQGEGFTEAMFSMLALKMFVDKILKRIYKGYKNLTEILRVWRKGIVEGYAWMYEMCTGDAIIKEIETALDIPPEPTLKDKALALIEKAKNAAAAVQGIISDLMALFQDVAQLAAEAAKIVQDFIAAFAKAVITIIKKLIELVEMILKGPSAANISLPAATPLFDILLGLVSDKNKEKDEEEQKKEDEKNKHVTNWEDCGD